MRRLCIFDLDHTLVRSSLDLAAMALDMRGVLEQACGPLPARPARYRVGELLELCERRAPGLLATLWDIALAHERRALADAAPGSAPPSGRTTRGRSPPPCWTASGCSPTSTWC